MYYLITALHIPLYVFGFCVGVVVRPIFSGFSKGYFFVEVSELLTKLKTIKKDIDLAESLTKKYSVGQELNE